jgi:hypothetical protein
MEEKKMKYQIIDKMGCTVAEAETIDDARYAAWKYDAKHIYDRIADKYRHIT